MDTLHSASPPPAGTGDGIARQSSGQADTAPAGSVSSSTPTGASDQPGPPPAPASDQPAETPKSGLGWSSLTDAERDYKHLQGAFTKATQHLASFGDLRAAQANLQLLESLKSDPDFVEWAKGKVAKAQTGSQDPETLKALDIVDQRAEAKARELIGQVVGPLYDQYLAQKQANVWAAMDKQYGPDWQTYKGAMKALHERDLQAGRVNPAVEENFDYQYVEDLFLRAAGRDPQYAAKQAQRSLAAKQAIATSPHPGTPAHAIGTGGTARSLQDAFDQAKKQLGWG